MSVIAAISGSRKLVRRYDRALSRTPAQIGKLGAALLTSWSNEFDYKLEMIMSQGKAKARSRKDAQGDFKWKGFVNLQMSGDQRAAFQDWQDENDDPFVLMTIVLTSGYKLGQTYNPSNQSFIATLTCTDMELPNGGYVMSAFHSSLEDAIAVLMYKHFNICNEIWPIEGYDGDKRPTFG